MALTSGSLLVSITEPTVPYVRGIMAQPIYVKFLNHDGDEEATASRYAEVNSQRPCGKPKLLPEGHWRILTGRLAGRTLTVDDMPEHWITQLGKWGKFGRSV